ncbi:selenocysteine-specific translation elongation factor [Evansella cellulosilytica]|uniref:Selenocysteine-specific elongation factor n=1 Tax=Evansella cellulosilytica (strain ATCC 21833 / DSM 2522 / FERM P-1141 / JCM 9156 / N-4) TaxID=649639 RepID=E6U1N0_EVAC2|nr:selenocysteine-specific translation elongation factor [Evansella cellulosilytica]ADU30393.1 selenocysteine-specific translation elongation factor [Evansella cellulosilytica DSM 2522]
MTKQYYTIGMAGHVDHGKTSLTKALTNIETDRLKEEKERAISIELGYAPLKIDENTQVSIIDVPGHERFIRQMIAGVAGIDLVILVVAADEGVMPQTVEHLQILQLLGIHRGLIVVTKMDLVEEDMKELIEADIFEKITDTFFEGTELLFVDSVSKKGIPELIRKMEEYLKDVPVRNASGPFRLPIDQVFTVHGQGTVVRGTVYEGEVKEGEVLELLPQQKKVRARQLQVHNETQSLGRAGQRLAINVGGIAKNEVKRGDVLVSTQYYTSTKTIDVCLDTFESLKFSLKQRNAIKLHLGTAEVYGKIVFFDRNELTAGRHVLCQLRLDQPVVTRRGDRFILRRPTPVETVGGGFVIDPNGEKYKFGERTIALLSRKKEGTPEERIIDVLKVNKSMTLQELEKEASVPATELQEIVTKHPHSPFRKLQNQYMLKDVYDECIHMLTIELNDYHNKFPLREGKNKAELMQQFNVYGSSVIEAVIEEGIVTNVFKKNKQFIATYDFSPSFPKQWERRMNQVILAMEKEGLQVSPFTDLVNNAGIPLELQEELRHFLLRTSKVIELDEKHILSKTAFEAAVQKVKENIADKFDLQTAKSVLNISRKYLVPLLEAFDEQKVTKREGNERVFLDNK